MSEIDISLLGSSLVQDEFENAVPLASLWKDSTAILVFLRHFACLACRAHVLKMLNEREKLEAKCKIYFIGTGTPAFVSRFRADLKIKDARIFTDPSLVSFRLAGFKRGFLASVGPMAIKNYLGLLASGHRASLVDAGAGDIWQLGGVLVISQAGELKYRYISEVAGDFPPDNDVESAVRS